MGNQPCGMLFRQIELLVLLAGAVHSLSLSTQKTDLIFGSKGAAQAWQGTYNMTHADKILPADSAPCKQIFTGDPLWSEDSPQAKCPSCRWSHEKWGYKVHSKKKSHHALTGKCPSF